MPGRLIWIGPCLVLFAAPLALSQAAPPTSDQKAVHGQDSMAGSSDTATGWVQAPLPRGKNDPHSVQGHADNGPASPTTPNGQQAPGQNPGTRVANPNPGPSGVPQAPPSSDR